jgi:hypothetical protein
MSFHTLYAGDAASSVRKAVKKISEAGKRHPVWVVAAKFPGYLDVAIGDNMPAEVLAMIYNNARVRDCGQIAVS